MKASDLDNRGRMRVSSSETGILRRFFGFVTALCVILAIFMITGLLLVRTEGGHDFIDGRVEAFLGEKVEIQRIRIGWPYQLVLEKLSTEAIKQDGPGFKALEVRVALAWPDRLRVHVHRGVVHLVRKPDEMWLPPAFSRLAVLPSRNVSDISELTKSIRRRIVLEMTDCSVKWMEESGQSIASAQGVSFDMRPVNMPGADYYHYQLAVYNMTDAEAGQFYDMEREWIASDMRPYVELARSSRKSPIAGDGFWEVPE